MKTKTSWVKWADVSMLLAVCSPGKVLTEYQLDIIMWLACVCMVTYFIICNVGQVIIQWILTIQGFVLGSVGGIFHQVFMAMETGGKWVCGKREIERAEVENKKED